MNTQDSEGVSSAVTEPWGLVTAKRCGVQKRLPREGVGAQESPWLPTPGS